MKDPDNNAVITVKNRYHSKREQISYATLFSSGTFWNCSV